MAKVSMVQRELKRQEAGWLNMAAKPRRALKEIATDESEADGRAFQRPRLKLAKLPRNSSPTRLHNRCQLTRAPQGVLPRRELKMSRESCCANLASKGQIPGMVKSSW